MAFNGKFILQWRNFGLKIGAKLSTAPTWAQLQDDKFLEEEFSRDDFHALLVWIKSTHSELAVGRSFGSCLRFNLAGLVGNLVQSCPNIKKSVEVLSEFYQLGCPEIKLELKNEEGLVLSMQADPVWKASYPDDVATLEETLLVFCDRFLKELNDKFTGFAKVSLGHKPFGTSEQYEKALGIKVSLAQVTSFKVSEADLSLPVISRDQETFKELYQFCQFKTKLKADDLTWKDKVKNQIKMTLPGHKGSLKEISFSLAMTERTLQRKLKSENVDFRACQKELWKQLNEELLSKGFESKLISEFLGFQSVSNFKKAIS